MKDKTGPIEKPIILAICGKSCTGKDTLARWLERYFTSIGIPAHRMISATTRPRRIGENETDYFFMTEEFFKRNVRQGKFFETTKFRDWHYGLFKSEIKPGAMNIGVFDLRGLEHLYQHRIEYLVMPIYLKQDSMVRLKRSKERERRWRLEHFRRMVADDIHFRKAEEQIKKFGKYIILDRMKGNWDSTLIIKDRLKRFKVLIFNEEGRLRLGNFV